MGLNKKKNNNVGTKIFAVVMHVLNLYSVGDIC